MVCHEDAHEWTHWPHATESDRADWSDLGIAPGVEAVSHCVRCSALRMKMGDRYLLRIVDGPTIIMVTNGRTIQEELELQKASTQKIRDDFYTMLDRPTREGAELNLKLHTLERERHILERDIADEVELARRAAPIDIQLAEIRHLIGLRAKVIEVGKLKFELADQTSTGAEQKNNALRLTALLGEIAKDRRRVEVSLLGIPQELMDLFDSDDAER